MQQARVQTLPFLDIDDREVDVSPLGLTGILNIPEGASSAVVILPGATGSGRFSPRNAYIAAGLRRAGLGTLVIDLLTNAEDGRRENVFDIARLADRLAIVSRWLRENGAFGDRPIATFPFGTAGAAALVAAARDPGLFRAIVCRSGRIELAGPVLDKVTTPTLLVVGGMDHDVMAVSRRSLDQFGGEKELRIIPGTSQLFEEAGTLDLAIQYARDWILAYP